MVYKVRISQRGEKVIFLRMMRTIIVWNEAIAVMLGFMIIRFYEEKGLPYLYITLLVYAIVLGRCLHLINKTKNRNNTVADISKN